MRIMKPISFGLIFLLVLNACSNFDSGNNRMDVVAGDPVIKADPLAEINDKIDKDRSNDQLYIQRAKYYLTLNETDSAFRDIFVAIDINGQDAGHLIVLSDAYLVIGNPDKCKDALDKALSLDPTNPVTYQKLAELYLIIRDYGKMHEALNKALQLDGFNPTAYYIRGLGLIEQSDSLAAADAFKMAVFQDQDFFDAYMQLGLIYSAINDPLAIEYFNTAINLQPENTLPYYNLGLFYQENESIQKALANYQMILEIQPGHVNTLYNLGYIYLVYEQDFETALDYFTQVVELEPNYADAYNNRGFTHELLGEYDRARDDYKQTLEIKANYTKAIDALNRLD
jgi:tetratricopeptide (TPR) repeat protein